MTGFGPREIAEVAGKDNPYRILWKPFKTESLLQMIENVLGESERASV
jgi:DNA-binding NtrC family response regulator